MRLGPHYERLTRRDNLATALDFVLPSGLQVLEVPGEGKEVPLEVRRQQIGAIAEVRVADRHPRLLRRHAKRRLRQGSGRIESEVRQ